MALSQRVRVSGDWLQRILAFITVLSWMAPTVGAWIVAKMYPATAAQAYLYTIAAGAVTLVVWFVWSSWREPGEPSGLSAKDHAVVIPAPNSTLATLRELGFRFDAVQTNSNPPKLNWHELEDRFRLITGEAEAVWHLYESGSVVWFVYPAAPGANRIVDRFLSEARIAGRLVSGLPHVPKKFNGHRHLTMPTTG